MTEWDASAYAKRSALQESMAAEVLALLNLRGNELILDVGCGDGRVTAEIATRVPLGSVLGVDASHDMIAFASAHARVPNLRFQQASAAELTFEKEFDLIVSFNALHWLPDQDAPLQCIRAALKPDAAAQLRLVTDGPRKSLETVLEETRRSGKWQSYFQNFRDPYLHVTPDQYAQLAERHSLRVQSLHTASKSWDFHTRETFFNFGQVTFVEWTRVLPASEKPAFITDVLNNYAQATAAPDSPNQNTFHFYQTDITLQ
jgi:trans-aconitate 2-methyltransferase